MEASLALWRLYRLDGSLYRLKQLNATLGWLGQYQFDTEYGERPYWTTQGWAHVGAFGSLRP